MKYLMLLFGISLLIGCGGPRYTTMQTQTNGITISYQRPERPIVNQEYTLTVQINDDRGQPIEAADVYLDLTMPAMPMGTNQPIADALGHGTYQVKTVFTMEGLWRVTVHANKGGTSYSAFFDHDVFLP